MVALPNILPGSESRRPRLNGCPLTPIRSPVIGGLSGLVIDGKSPFSGTVANCDWPGPCPWLLFMDRCAEFGPEKDWDTECDRD